ncbi:hypothetical protein CHA_P10002 [Pseudomonas phage CHA_P1]|uniref:Portal protein n=1 Tax=Pseudomonas phage CHA_P1 TaxID=1327965 RepID=V5JVY9_9CAUD|nr:portal protein [Pseudomonas phage CHA_P1]AGR88956.1 hypothetical protein CHA_P10002 [Pseudomonas phage CHA_P1]
MARRKRNVRKAAEVPSAPRLRLGEIGHTGLKQSGGAIYEETRAELRFPENLNTFKVMARDATIASALALFELMVSRVEWSVKGGTEPDAAMQEKVKFLSQVMHDMDHTWYDFIKEVTSCFTYGFSIHEKVYRKRTWANGSKYNDNKIGLKRLPVRSQETIRKWRFSEDGRDFLGAVQSPKLISGWEQRYGTYLKNLPNGGDEIFIPKEKFLNFRIDPRRDNPEGNSPLKNVYFAWSYRTALEEQEAVGITRDMNGMPTLYIPPRYMSPDASDEEKAIYEYYKNAMRNITMNEQTSLILPQQFDPESRLPLFKFELTSSQGGKMYDTDAIIKRWDNKILQVLFADVLKMGQDNVGSYSLAGAKTNLMAMAIEARLQMIRDVLNNDLVPQLFRLNGYRPDEEFPTFEFGDLDEIDLDVYSKAIQRMMSVGGLEFTRDVANRNRKAIGLPELPASQAIDREALPLANDSKAGEGMKTAGEGTSKSPSARDDSTANQDN